MITNISTINNPTWQAQSVCKDYDPAIWFAKGRSKDAKNFCAVCPVREQCLDWILILEKEGSATARTGIYAGLTPNQRKKIPLCKYANCVVRTKERGIFCSEEHRQQHLDDLKRARKGEDTTGVYYKQGLVPRGH